MLGEPHHGVRLAIVLVDVARAGVQRERRVPADDLEELVQVERRGHRPRGADERRELAVALLGGPRRAHVVQRDGGEGRHLAGEPLVVGREPALALLLGQLEHAEDLVAVDDRRPHGGLLAPVLHGLEARGGGVDLVVGVGAQDLAPLDDALEPGRVARAGASRRPSRCRCCRGRATRAPARAARGARGGTRRRSTRSSRGRWRPARREGPGCRRAARPVPRRRGGRARRRTVAGMSSMVRIASPLVVSACRRTA